MNSIARTAKKKFARVGFGLLNRSQIYRGLGYVLPTDLTVLLYHRIDDPSAPGFYGFASNVSATRVGFARHLDWLRTNRTVISLDTLAAAVGDGQPLPKNAVLITFDDGYRDNFTNALPELASRSLPSVLFLTTGAGGDRQPFFWDLAAQAFEDTKLTYAALPIIGERSWRNGSEVKRIGHEWIEAVKKRPRQETSPLLKLLNAALELDTYSQPPSGLMASWAEIAAMETAGMAIEAHTVTHPILTRIPRDSARSEVADSRDEIERRLKKKVRSFAYPNGMPGDVLPHHIGMLQELGFDLAFLAHGGTTSVAEARQTPHAIRRICITLKDDVDRLAAKTAGLTRVWDH